MAVMNKERSSQSGLREFERFDHRYISALIMCYRELLL